MTDQPNPYVAARASFDQTLESMKPTLEVIGGIYKNAIKAGVPEKLASDIARYFAMEGGMISSEWLDDC